MFILHKKYDNGLAVIIAAKIEEDRYTKAIEVLSDQRKKIKEGKTDLEESLIKGSQENSKEMLAGINAYKFVLDTQIGELIDEYTLKMIYYNQMSITGEFKEEHTAQLHGKTFTIHTPLKEYSNIMK